ncbi:crAss001_48 related protein [Limosilactobacillus mucosae]
MENKELIKKLKKEQAKLDKKLLKLAIFLMDQEDSQTVSDLQLNLLNVQRDAMSKYSNVLGMRINDLEEQHD